MRARQSYPGECALGAKVTPCHWPRPRRGCKNKGGVHASIFYIFHVRTKTKTQHPLSLVLFRIGDKPVHKLYGLTSCTGVVRLEHGCVLFGEGQQYVAYHCYYGMFVMAQMFALQTQLFAHRSVSATMTLRHRRLPSAFMSS